MPAIGALVDVTAQHGRAAANDGSQDLQVQSSEPIPAALVERGSGCADQVGHLQRWPRHLFGGKCERVQRAGGGADMSLGKMDVHHRLAQVGMAEQQLDRAQVGAAFEQMCGEAVSKRVGVQRFVHAAALGRRRQACQTTFSVIGVSAL